MSALQTIKSSFERIGARALIRPLSRESAMRLQRPMSIDVINDGLAEAYDIQLLGGIWLNVLDVRPRQQHLLLSARNPRGEDRFLCGHDEFHWFVAALPGAPDDVHSAKESLKPDVVKSTERRKRRKKHNRRNDVFMRQGEWFFIPCRHAQIDQDRVERNAPLLRGVGSKPHVCEFLFRDGEPEYECDRYPKLAFFESEYREILRTRRKAKQWNWRRLPFNPKIYVKGWITHPDHSPFHFDVWHRVEMNRESTELNMTRVLFLD